MGSSALFTNHIVGRSSLHYTDLTALPQPATESIAFSVRADSPIADGKDLLRRLKEDPSAVSFGLRSAASSNHIASAAQRDRCCASQELNRSQEVDGGERAGTSWQRLALLCQRNPACDGPWSF